MEPIKRMTEKQSDGTYLIYANMLAPINENAFAGPAAERLAAFENAVEIAQNQLAATTAKIDALKASGKARGSSTQQLVAQKLTYATMLHLMGIEDE